MLELAGAIIGLARFAILWTTVPFLELITITEPHRGKGCSRRMLEFLKAHLTGAGYVTLLSSSQTDEPSSSLAQPHGLSFERDYRAHRRRQRGRTRLPPGVVIVLCGPGT